MKITFVYTDYSQFNQNNFNRGVAILSSCLKKAGFGAGLIHISRKTGKREFVRLVKEEKPDLIAFSFVSNMLPQVKDFSLWVKELGIPALHGGMHPTVAPEDCLSMEGVSAICRGEGEGAIVDFCRAMESGRSARDIPNIWIKEDGRIYKNPCRNLIEDLDTLPYPDYELFHYEDLEESVVHKILVTQASRGCLYKCTYCCNHAVSSLYANSAKFLRHYSVDRLLDEIEFGLRKYPSLKEIRFYDDTLTQDKVWLKEFAAKYKARIGLPYSSSERVENVDEETAAVLKESGCSWLDLGIENGDSFIREQYMNRRMSDGQIIKAFSILQSHGIRTNGFNIIGMVGETPSSILKTVKLNATVNPFIVYNSYFYPFKGTRIYEIVKERAYPIDPGVSTFSDRPAVKLDTVTKAQLMFFYKYLFFLTRLYRFLWSRWGREGRAAKILDGALVSKYFPYSILNFVHFGKEDIMRFLRKYPGAYAFFRKLYKNARSNFTKPKAVARDAYLSLRRLLLGSLWLGRGKRDLNIKAGDVGSILAIRCDAIGDLVVSLSALKALREAFPRSRLVLLIRPGNEALLKNVPWIDEKILYKGFFKTIGELRRRHFDLAVDFFTAYFIKTALIAHMSNAKITAGYDIEKRGCFFDIKVRPLGEKAHLSRLLLNLSRAVAGSFSGTEPDDVGDKAYLELPVPDQDKAYIEKILKENGIEDGELLIGIHPGGRYPSQRWPVEYFSRLADRIAKKHKARIVLLAGAEEAPLVDRMRGLMRESQVRITGLSLDKFTALVARMDLFICNNSGPLHIAVSVGTPTVSTMGPTDPDLWRPVGKEHIVIRNGLPCSPCESGFCRYHECLKAITVDEMEKAVDLQLERISGGEAMRTTRT